MNHSAILEKVSRSSVLKHSLEAVLMEEARRSALTHPVLTQYCAGLAAVSVVREVNLKRIGNLLVLSDGSVLRLTDSAVFLDNVYGSFEERVTLGQPPSDLVPYKSLLLVTNPTTFRICRDFSPLGPKSAALIRDVLLAHQSVVLAVHSPTRIVEPLLHYAQETTAESLNNLLGFPDGTLAAMEPSVRAVIALGFIIYKQPASLEKLFEIGSKYHWTVNGATFHWGLRARASFPIISLSGPPSLSQSRVAFVFDPWTDSDIPDVMFTIPPPHTPETVVRYIESRMEKTGGSPELWWRPRGPGSVVRELSYLLDSINVSDALIQ